MKFKERLWQLFLAIVLGVTLSVCDAGLQDDELESSSLIAGSAIAAGVTSGDGYFKIGEFIVNYGKFILNTGGYTVNFKEKYIFKPNLLTQCFQGESSNIGNPGVSNLTQTSVNISQGSGCSAGDTTQITWIALGQ